MLRFREKCVAPRHFPRNNCALVLRRLDHSPRVAGEAAMTVRSAATMMGNTAA